MLKPLMCGALRSCSVTDFGARKIASVSPLAFYMRHFEGLVIHNAMRKLEPNAERPRLCPPLFLISRAPRSKQINTNLKTC